MNTLLAKLKSRKFLSTIAAYALGVYMIKSGNITEGVALIAAAQGSYNLGEGIADSRAAMGGAVLSEIETTNEH